LLMAEAREVAKPNQAVPRLEGAWEGPSQRRERERVRAWLISGGREGSLEVAEPLLGWEGGEPASSC
jgi:hypothetical protein